MNNLAVEVDILEPKQLLVHLLHLTAKMLSSNSTSGLPEVDLIVVSSNDSDAKMPYHTYIG